jgi:hypothetical protein
MKKIDYTDSNGLRRRVLVKSEYDPPERGIPIDVYELLIEFYDDASTQFVHKLYNILWDLNLVEPSDFQQPANKAKIRQAINSALKRDSTDLQRYILNITES